MTPTPKICNAKSIIMKFYRTLLLFSISKMTTRTDILSEMHADSNSTIIQNQRHAKSPESIPTRFDTTKPSAAWFF